MPDRWAYISDALDVPWDDTQAAWFVGEKGERHVWVQPMIFTAALIIGPPRAGWYDDRWCYRTPAAAIAAARAWEGDWPATEPEGWHKHPLTGRRA